MATDLSPEVLSGNPIISEAKKRWNRVSEWESVWRVRFLEDLKFRHGDSDNGYQWPDSVRRNRDSMSKPCLTVNQIAPFNLNIINEAKKNKSSPTVTAMGNGATAESANMMMAVIRHIEAQSDAQTAYGTALEFQVDGGLGWWRLVTRYADPGSFDQEIFIERIPDPLSVFIDPDAKELDKSDAKWAFVFDTMPKEEFKEAYPKYADKATQQPLGLGSTMGDWGIGEDDVRICEYFRRVVKDDQLASFPAENGQRKTLRRSRSDDGTWKGLVDNPLTRIRDVVDEVVEWKLIVGETVVEETVWPGKWIPLIPAIGTEIIIDGQLDRKGHTRALKDAQRMYNYNASGQVEFVALQSKTPYIAPAEAIEELEQYWNSANVQNFSVLPYKSRDESGNEIKPPMRQEPPNYSPGFANGMEVATQQLMQASGQFQNQLGQPGNERTGAAIGKRVSQAQLATYHFEDHFATALRSTAKQLIDLVPKVYDSPRILACQADDGTEMEVSIDPTARQAYLEHQARNGEIVRRVFNPALGKYQIAPSVGPSFDSQREETTEALSLLLTQAPALTGIVGDLLLKNMGFKDALEAARRLKRMIPPQALGQGPSPTEQSLQAQVKNLSKALAESLTKQAQMQLKLVGKDQLRDIDVYEAETGRISALKDVISASPESVQALVTQLVNEAMGTSLQPIIQANADDIDDDRPENQVPEADPTAMYPGAKKAPDGQWYLADPTRQGKFLRVDGLAQERKPRMITQNA